MQLTSVDFTLGGSIPSRFTCEGDNVSPEFSWKEAPAGAKCFALILHDPDAPRAGGFTHWILYMISRQKRPTLILTFPNRSTYPARVPRVGTIVAKSATWARVPLPALIVITPGSSRSTPRSAFHLEQLTRNSARPWKVMS